jgi:hypothetical protein
MCTSSSIFRDRAAAPALSVTATEQQAHLQTIDDTLIAGDRGEQASSLAGNSVRRRISNCCPRAGRFLNFSLFGRFPTCAECGNPHLPLTPHLNYGMDPTNGDWTHSGFSLAMIHRPDLKKLNSCQTQGDCKASFQNSVCPNECQGYTDAYEVTTHSLSVSYSLSVSISVETNTEEPARYLAPSASSYPPRGDVVHDDR